MVQLPAMWDITAPTARRQYDYRSDGIYFSGESGLREAAGVAVSAAVGARMGAVADPVGRARPRSSSSAPAGNPKNRFFNEAPRDDPEYGDLGDIAGRCGPRLVERRCVHHRRTRRRGLPARTKKHPRRRHEADVGTCKVCMDKNIDCVIVPRGHLACCPRCARLVDAAGQRCPISAQDIAMIQQISNA